MPRHLRLALYTDAGMVGGAEISLGNLLVGLSPRVHATVIGTRGPVVEAVAARRPGTPAVVVRAGRGLPSPRALASHLRALRRVRPDVVHVNLQAPWAARYAIVAALLLRRRVVAVHQLPLATEAPALLRWLAWSSRRIAAVVAVGDPSAREIETLAKLPAGAVRTIHNGVPPAPAVAALPREGHGTTVVGSLGRLTPQKGYDVLLRALAQVPSASAVIVGDGPEREALRSLAARLDLDGRLEVRGWHDDPRSLLTEFDVFVLPSRQEGFPLAIAEAMMAALPIVASRVGSIEDAVLDGKTGLLVPPDDAPALARALAELVERPERAAAMGAAGRERAVRSFSSAAMCRSYEQLYDAVART